MVKPWRDSDGDVKVTDKPVIWIPLAVAFIWSWVRGIRLQQQWAERGCLRRPFNVTKSENSIMICHLFSFSSDSVITEKIDLGFAISATAVIADETFQKIKDTVKSIIKKYGVGNLRYAVISYGSDAKLVVSFQSNFSALENWLTTIDSIQLEQGTPAMGKALQKAKQMFQSGARSDAKKVLVVIADKSPTGDKKAIETEAQELDIDDVKVIPVAIGDEIDPKEIEEISPYKDVLVDVPKDVDPTDLAKAVMNKVLKGNDNFYAILRHMI